MLSRIWGRVGWTDRPAWGESPWAHPAAPALWTSGRRFRSPRCAVSPLQPCMRVRSWIRLPFFGLVPQTVWERDYILAPNYTGIQLQSHVPIPPTEVAARCCCSSLVSCRSSFMRRRATWPASTPTMRHYFTTKRLDAATSCTGVWTRRTRRYILPPTPAPRDGWV